MRIPMLNDQLLREAIYADFLAPWWNIIAELTKWYIGILASIFGG